MKLTREMIQAKLPPKQAKRVNSGVIDHINKIIQDPETRELFQENLINYNTILQEGKYKIGDYVNAVMYISFKMQNMTNIDAYTRTFPDRMDRYKAERKSMEEIHNFVSGYNRSKLVVTLTQKVQTPTWILNMDVHQEAINTNVQLMRHSKNDVVRQKAASDLMNYLTPPQEAELKIDIGVGDTFLSSMRTAIRELSVAQQQEIKAGTRTPVSIAESKIIDAEVVEVSCE